LPPAQEASRLIIAFELPEKPVGFSGTSGLGRHDWMVAANGRQNI
jgi:hypothetical protein